MTRIAVFLLSLLAGSCLAAEPGPGYELVEQTKPDGHAEFFGEPHIDTAIEVYSKSDSDSAFGKSFKIILSSLADPSQKELLFEYERGAVATLSPNGTWIVINDRPFRGECNPRLFKQRAGLKFDEVKEAAVRRKAIEFFLRDNKYSRQIGEHLLPPGACFVESMLWSDDSKSLLLRLSKGQTGEPLWINDWRCVYDLTTGKVSTDLRVLNRGTVQPGKYLAPVR